jgi:hypothetical protein
VLARPGDVTVWRVDGHWIRDHLDVDFTNGSHDLIASYVPAGEIWLDREATRPGDEWKIWMAFQLTHRRRMAAGASYLEALARAERVELAARRAALGGGRVDRRTETVRAAALGRLLEVIDGVRVHLVHGRAVRDHAYVHFTMGGHGRRYRFIPMDEIWIDDTLVPAERPAVVHHELVELRLMNGSVRGERMSYHDAHALASAAERRFRRRTLAQRARRG